MKLIFFSTFDRRERRIRQFAMGQGYAIVLSYNQMKLKSNRKLFTTDLAKKGENNESLKMKISKPIIYLYFICATLCPCGVNPEDFVVLKSQRPTSPPATNILIQR